MSEQEKAVALRGLSGEEGRELAHARRILANALEEPALHQDEVTFCPKCGQINLANGFKCTRCELVLHGPPGSPYVTVDAGLGGLVPYRNAPALWAYYLGVFSLIPFLGIPLGIAGIILGIKGLALAKRQPQVRGVGHGWTGIALGAVSTVLYISLIVAFVLIQ